MALLRRSAGAAAVFACALALTACGQRDIVIPTTGNSLTGIVKYGNEQLQFAMVLVSGGLSQTQGMIREDGTYFVDNCPEGDVLVAVNSDAGRGMFMSKSMAAGAYAGPDAKGAGKKKVDVKFIEVPKKYFDPTTSGLKTTIAKGENKFDIIIPK